MHRTGGAISLNLTEQRHLEEWRQALPAPGAAGTGRDSRLNLTEQRHLEELRQALPIEADLVGRPGSAGDFGRCRTQRPMW